MDNYIYIYLLYVHLYKTVHIQLYIKHSMYIYIYIYNYNVYIYICILTLYIYNYIYIYVKISTGKTIYNIDMYNHISMKICIRICLNRCIHVSGTRLTPAIWPVNRVDWLENPLRIVMIIPGFLGPTRPHSGNNILWAWNLRFLIGTFETLLDWQGIIQFADMHERNHFLKLHSNTNAQLFGLWT